MLLVFIISIQVFKAELMRPIPRRQPALSSVMALNNDPICVLPLRSCCSLAAAEHCSRTSTGMRCALSCCVNLMPGFHFTNNSSCNHSRPSYSPTNYPPQAQASVLSAHPCSNISAVFFAPSALNTMPRLCPRMRCRRGSSCGQVNRRSSPSTSDSSSFSSEFGPVCFPASRMGRGRGRDQSNPTGHFRLSSRAHSHQARLQFPCTLSNISLLATVTINLREFSSGQTSSGHAMATPEEALEPKEEAKHCISQKDNQQSVNPGIEVDVGLQAGSSAPNEGGSVSKDCPPPEEDDPYKFACLIVEEEPPSSHEV